MALLLILIAYCGSYLYLRKTQCFIHRAGYYETTNHYIEAGHMADGPQIFMAATFIKYQDKSKMTENEFKKLLQDTYSANEKEYIKRKRILWLYLPLSTIETFYWKMTNPYPLQTKPGSN